MEQLSDPVLPVTEIVAKCPQKQLMSVYKIPAFQDVDQFLQMVAAARGKLAKVCVHLLKLSRHACSERRALLGRSYI